MTVGIETPGFGSDVYEYLAELELFGPVNRNHLFQTADMTDTDYWPNGDGVTVLASILTDPVGGTDAFKLTAAGSVTGEYLGQTLDPADTDKLIWSVVIAFRAGTLTGCELRCNTNNNDSVSARFVCGPGTIEKTDPATTVDDFVISGLSTNYWTIIEFTWITNTGLPSPYQLRLYPGDSGTTVAGTIHVFAPHLEPSGPPDAFGYRVAGQSLTTTTAAPDNMPIGTSRTLRVSRGGFISDSADTEPHEVFQEGLLRPFSISTNGGGPGNLVSGVAVTNVGSIELANPDGLFDHIADYDFRGRQAKFYRATDDIDDFASFDTIAGATADSPVYDLDKVSIRIRDPLSGMDRNIDLPKMEGRGQCVRLDGTGDYVECGEVPHAWLIGDLTIAGWVRTYNGVANGYVVSYGGDGTTNPLNSPYGVGFSKALGRMYYNHHYGAGGPNSESAFVSLPDATMTDGWHKFAITRNILTKVYTFYYEGKLLGSDTYTNNPTGGWDGTLKIGTEESTGSGWEGDIDEVKIWNRVLSLEEINATCCPLDAEDQVNNGLKVYYRLDEGLETFTWDRVSNTISRRMIETYISYDGVGDYSRIANHADIQPNATSFTHEVRVCAADVSGSNDWIMYKDSQYRMFYNSGNGELRASVYLTPLANWVTSGIAYSPGEDGDVLLTMRWDESTKVLSLFIDGANKDDSPVQTGESSNSATNDYYLGSVSSVTGFSRSWVYEVRHWDTALSDADILANVYGVLTGNETNLKMWHTMAEARARPVYAGMELVVDPESNYGKTIHYDRQYESANKKNTTAFVGTMSRTTGELQGDARFVGTGQGMTDMIGRAFPLVGGLAHHVPLHNIDPLNHVFIGSIGPLEDYEFIFEGGRELSIVELTSEDDVWDYDNGLAPTKAYTLQGTAWTDKTADVADSAAHDGDVPFMHATPGSNTLHNGVYMAYSAPVSGIDLWVYKGLGNVDKIDPSKDIVIGVEYWNGETWAPHSALMDATDGFRIGGKNWWGRQLTTKAGLKDIYIKTDSKSGSLWVDAARVRWTKPTDWVQDSLNNINTAMGIGGLGPADSTPRFWWRFACTANPVGYLQQPSLSAAWIAEFDAVYDLSTGHVRMTSPPFYPLTAHIKGQQDTVGTWPQTVTDVAVNLMTRYGKWVSGNFTTGFSALGLDATISLYIELGDNDATFRGVLAPRFKGNRSVLFGNRSLEIDLAQIGNPDDLSVDAVLKEDEDHFLALSVQEGALAATRIEYYHKPYYTSFGEGDLNLLLPAEIRKDMLSDFRQQPQESGLTSSEDNHLEAQFQKVISYISAPGTNDNIETESAEWATMIISGRKFHTQRIPIGAIETEIGKVLGLAIRRYRLWSGAATASGPVDYKKTIILSIAEDPGGGSSTLVSWG